MNNYFALFEDDEEDIHYIPASDMDSTSDVETELSNEYESTDKNNIKSIETILNSDDMKEMYEALKFGLSWYDIIYPRNYSRTPSKETTTPTFDEDKSISSTDTWVMVDNTDQTTGKRRRNPYKKQPEIVIRKQTSLSEPLKKKPRFN